ncbi:Serine/threonine-protein kinase PBS1, putative [Ricinus communis]|uniref:Receptor-like serine/threonine-protein kinase n=1 Tax=Ricinus communis TaxID=3988 RepID=B9RQP5_RICCO|nr:Serine/threonine-protein kinase PBS1, putative [Ricinus communis]|eukprot:XP_025012548.1 G-type lectin S-receptor-like serine/threonine-protein kinase CES101 [Ricinus communis]
MANMKKNLFLLSFSCFLLLLTRPSHSQTRTILQGGELKYDQELVSADGMFKLKFGTVGESGESSDSYLGIWYNYIEEKFPVWVANRDTPIFGNSGILTVDSQGNLKILRDKGRSIVLYSVQKAIYNAIATLEDTGNFILRELNSNGSIKQVLWQSFDYPTDTFLPGMKLGINLKTGQQWSVISWRSFESPARGTFVLGTDPDSKNQLVIWRQGHIYWASGSWVGQFSLLGGLSFNVLYNFSYFSDENESYFIYSINKANSIFPRLTINAEGVLIGFLKYDYHEEVKCITSYDYMSPTVGCLEQNLPNCRSPSDAFLFKPRTGYMYSDGFKYSDSENLTMIDCKLNCLKNCSCIAYASKNEDGTGCEIWRSARSFIGSSSDDSRKIYIFDEVNKWWLPVTITLGGIFLIPALCAFLYAIWKKCSRTGNGKTNLKNLWNELEGNALSLTTYDTLRTQKNEWDELHIFCFEIIAIATKYFKPENKLGEGGFGPVYKGKLLDGQEIAIKRLSRSSGQGLVEFKNEAILIAKLQHTNLVKLLGFCVDGEERILVYEYMPKKSLDIYLFDSHKKSELDWKKRFKIIDGITQGLLYLHKYSRLKVIHRDLKASNILLDDEMNPKISDFGMARIFGLKESEANTNRIVGTYGYMSPEYAMNGVVSTKTDVFSFGVLLLEIISGRKNTSFHYSECPINLIGYAWLLWKDNRGLELIDPKLDEFLPQNQVLRCIHIGLLCVQDHAADRPTVFDVVSMLSNETILLATPKQPAFFVNAVVQEPGEPRNRSDKCSINLVSISVMEAR